MNTDVKPLSEQSEYYAARAAALGHGAPMSAIDLAVARLKAEEGFRDKKYVDAAGKMTIGYGFNVDAGISEPEAAALLEAQSITRLQALSGYAWFKALDDVRASVVLDLSFNLGVTGLLLFHNMIVALGNQDWQAAHDALIDSQAARELPQRYSVLAQLLLNGA